MSATPMTTLVICGCMVEPPGRIDRMSGRQDVEARDECVTGQPGDRAIDMAGSGTDRASAV
jgi:hypothetical protein